MIYKDFQNLRLPMLGFGSMRLPLLPGGGDGDVDEAAVAEMVALAMERGANYFDTAYGYHNGNSERVMGRVLSRYPRESWLLASKFPGYDVSNIRPDRVEAIFEEQLEKCGVDYFDFYLMHAQNKDLFARYKQIHAYETVMALRDEGKIRHFGISFHDKAEVLDQILTEYPQIEVVQIQFNYVDYEDPSVESRKCYEVCCKHGKPVIVMEPVKGGSLVNLPEDAQKVLDVLHGGSNASYAIRFAASFPGIRMVLSGMGSTEMMADNCGFMKDFRPLNEEERLAIARVCAIFRGQGLIPCTGCRYCTEVCPQGIPIPDLFACMNAKKQFRDWNSDNYYHDVHTKNGAKASDCLKCGQCEDICPQHLSIRELLEDVAQEFEKQ